MELAAQITTLTANLSNLPNSKIAFAVSLIGQYAKKRTLSDRQIPYVAELVKLATGQVPAAKTTDVGDFGGIVNLFKQAGTKLKYPKIRLQVPGSGLIIRTVILSVAGAQSKAPGSINVAGEGSWGNRDWYGRVSPEGQFDRARATTDEFAAALIPVLQELSSDPIAAVQRYGKLTGHCMFCGTELSDARSKAAGFGPVCADKWNLGDQWKQAAKLGPVPVAAVA
jgi:hypothetical protein